MVSQSYSHHCDKRFNRAFSPYVGSSGYPEARVYIHPPPDSRSLMSDHQGERTETPTRKRIAVACGRCRQRKIRCSGNSGLNIPCTNCKNAGVTQCLFLRVSSRETSIKGDVNLGSFGSVGDLSNLADFSQLGSLCSDFNYNPVVARALATRTSIPSQSYGASTSASPINKASPGVSGRDFDYRAPIQQMKSHYFNTQPRSNGYGKDFADYTIPSCNSYGISSANALASSSTSDALSDSPGHYMVAYQPWDSRGRESSAAIEQSTPMIPAAATLLSGSDASPRLSHRIETAMASKATAPEASDSAEIRPVTRICNTGSSPTSSLAYRLASAVDSNGVYNHPPTTVDNSFLHSSIEGVDQISSGTLISMPRLKACDLISRSAAPSPTPGPQLVPHYIPHLTFQSATRAVQHPVPIHDFHSISNSATSSASQNMSQKTVHAATNSMHPFSYTGHITTDTDCITALGYPVSACGSPITNFAYGDCNGSTSNQVVIFDRANRNAGTQAIVHNSSNPAICLDNYNHESKFKTDSTHGTEDIVRQRSNRTTITVMSSESLARTSSTHASPSYSAGETLSTD